MTQIKQRPTHLRQNDNGKALARQAAYGFALTFVGQPVHKKGRGFALSLDGGMGNMTASMWADLTGKEQALKGQCRTFANEVIRRYYRQCDEENRFPREIHQMAQHRGLMNPSIPKVLGGLGLSHRAIAISGEELGSVCAPTAFSLGATHGALMPVIHTGTRDQKKVFVRELLERRECASLCLTEPDTSGSDVLAMKTVARQAEDGWVINGTKCMIGLGTEASLFLVFAETEIGKRRVGLSVFAVPRGHGIEIGANTDKIGFRSLPTPTIAFKDVKVPPESLIGQAGKSERTLLHTLDFMRFGGASVILGLVVGGLRDIIPWLEKRTVAQGETLIGKSNVQIMLGRFYGEVQAIRILLWRLAELIDKARPFGVEASIAKYRASALAMEASQEFVRLMGWRGLDADYPAQKRLRDAMATSIFEGSNEIMQLHAFRDLQKQVREGGDL